MNHPPSANAARISEIFSSLQGEGTHLGERHLFIRFEECHMHCGYCDELDKPAAEITLDEVMETVRQLNRDEGPHPYVSLTGGEPLLYLNFIKPLLLRLKAEGFKIYLETSGVLWRALEEVLSLCDCIAMDMKPASVTGEKNFFEEHRKFLSIASAKETFIKIVLSKSIDHSEFIQLIEIVRDIRPDTPVILQPISAQVEGHEDQELMLILNQLQQSALRKIPHVRIVPRFHRILKIR